MLVGVVIILGTILAKGFVIVTVTVAPVAGCVVGVIVTVAPFIKEVAAEKIGAF